MPLLWIVVIGAIPLVNGFSWQYSGSDGPANWGKEYQNCNGDSQSPIDIKTAQAAHSSEQLHFKVDDAIDAEYRVENTGHNAEVVITRKNLLGKREPTDKYKVVFKGQTYAALQYHFHWGSTDSEGSEHRMNGKPFSGEMHVVHWNTKYKSGDMLKHRDGVLVIGTFIKVGDDNDALKHVTDKLKDITKPDGETEDSEMKFSIQDILSGSIETQFFHYDGSLTTPPCSQTVSWVLGKDVIEMSAEQLTGFRKLQYKSEGKVANISENYRPVQNVNSRTVFTFRSAAANFRMGSSVIVPMLMITMYCTLARF